MSPRATQEEMFREIDAWRACPRCNSSNVLFRTTTKMYVCRRCGREWPEQKPRRKRKVKATR